MKPKYRILQMTGLLVALLGSNAEGQTINIFPYNFPFLFQPGTQLAGQVESNGMVWASAGPVGPGVTIAADNLPVPGLPLPTGNRARLTGVNGPAARIGLSTNLTSGTLYYSLALRVADLGTLSTNGSTLVAFGNAVGPSPTLPAPLAAALVMRAHGNGYQLGLAPPSGNTEDWIYWDIDWLVDQTVFVVASYTFVQGSANDILRLWVNPHSNLFGSSNAPPPSLMLIASVDIDSIQSFVLMQRPLLPAVTFVDEVRVGTSWASVTPPAPGSSDLRVQLQEIHAEAEIVGLPMSYLARVSNVGSNAATGINLRIEHRDVAVSGITASTTAGTAQLLSNAVQCALNPLQPGQSATVVLSLTPQAPGRLTVAANVWFDGVDLQPQDNQIDVRKWVIWLAPECACSCYSNAPRSVPDPMLTSWFTKNSGLWARLLPYSGAAELITWPAGPAPGEPIIVDRAYADVQKIQYTPMHVFISAKGLASYRMGPWICTTTMPFPDFPDDQVQPFQFPRKPDVSVCEDTGLDAIGLWVNGTAIYNMLDGFYYVAGRDSPDTSTQSADDNAPGISGTWHRNAWVSEGATFDSSMFHTANGQYHSHAQPMYLRAQMGDNVIMTVDMSGNIGSVYEMATPVKHSPILGWAFDGHPIYGPYAYSDPTNSASGFRRMRSGYVQRDGNNGTTDVRSILANITRRTSLPTWARRVQGRLFLLNSSEYGPATLRSTDYTECNPIEFSLGRYAEDFAYLGHLVNPSTELVYQQGVDFDLDEHNGRCCVTPEFPQGTYAYFVTINDDGTPAFPYVLGWQYCGKQLGREYATLPDTGLETYFLAPIPRMASQFGDAFRTNGLINLRWSSREGATYKVHVAEDLQNWTPIASGLPSGGANSSFNYDPGNPRPQKQFFKVELEKDGGPQP